MVKIREFRGFGSSPIGRIWNDRKSLPDQNPDGTFNRDYPETRFLLHRLENPEQYNDMTPGDRMLIQNAVEYHTGEKISLRFGRINDEEQALLDELAAKVGYVPQRGVNAAQSLSKDTTLDNITPKQLSDLIDKALDSNPRTKLSGHEKGLLDDAVEAHTGGKGVRFGDGLNDFEKARLAALKNDLRGKETVREVFKAPEAEAKKASEKKDTSKAQSKQETRDEEQEAQPRPLRELVDIALDEDFRTKHLTDAEQELLSKEVEKLTDEGVTFGKKLFGERINDEERARLEQLRDHLDGKAPKVEQSSTGEPSAGIAPLVEVIEEELPPLDDTAKQPDAVVEQRSPLTMDPVDSIATTAILSRAGEIDGPHDYLRDLDRIEVKIAQQHLGFKGDEVDGMWGEKTMAAAEQYIEQNDLDRNISFTNLQKHLEGRDLSAQLEQTNTQAAIGPIAHLDLATGPKTRPDNDLTLSMRGFRLIHSSLPDNQAALVTAINDSPETVQQAIRDEYMYFLDRDGDGVINEARVTALRTGIEMQERITKSPELQKLYEMASAELDTLTEAYDIKDKPGHDPIIADGQAIAASQTEKLSDGRFRDASVDPDMFPKDEQTHTPGLDSPGVA